MTEHVTTHRVEWGETDAAGIVFYPNYYRWFDNATHALFGHLGYPIPTMIAEGYAIPLLEANARFFQSLRYADDITVSSRIDEVRTRSFRVQHVVTRDTVTVAEGYEVRIWVRLESDGIRAEPIPNSVRPLIAAE